MKNELKTTAVFEVISNTDANFLNMHIDIARKIYGDKQLYLITHCRTQTLTLNDILLTIQLLNSPKQKGPFFF